MSVLLLLLAGLLCAHGQEAATCEGLSAAGDCGSCLKVDGCAFQFRDTGVARCVLAKNDEGRNGSSVYVRIGSPNFCRCLCVCV
jgi:hypothetical protein